MSRRNIGVELDLEIVTTDGTYRVKTNVQDQLRWEIAHGGAPWIRSEVSGSHTQMIETGFYGLKRTGQIERATLFERWVHTVTELWSHDEDDEDDEDGDDGGLEDAEPETFQ